MQVNIQHRYNDAAVRMLKLSSKFVVPPLPQPLADWIVKASFYRGYFLGPRSPLSSIDEQIANAADVLDDFSIEMMLNKVHLEDDLGENYPAHDFVLVYLSICDYFARYVLENQIARPMLLWYSTDAFDPAAEFPSHAMSFAFPRCENDCKYLEANHAGLEVRIGTKITLEL